MPKTAVMQNRLCKTRYAKRAVKTQLLKTQPKAKPQLPSQLVQAKPIA